MQRREIASNILWKNEHEEVVFDILRPQEIFDFFKVPKKDREAVTEVLKELTETTSITLPFKTRNAYVDLFYPAACMHKDWNKRTAASVAYFK